MREELSIEIENIQNIIPRYRKTVREGDAFDKNNEPVHYFFLEYLCNHKSGDVKAGDDLALAAWIPKNKLQTLTLTPPSIELYKELGWIKNQ